MPPTAVLTSAAQSDMLVEALFSHSLVTVGGHRVCMRKRDTDTEIERERERELRRGKLCIILCGHYAYGWHSLSSMCVGLFGGHLRWSLGLNEYLCVGGIHSQLVIVAWWETARGLRTRGYKDPWHIYLQVCVSERDTSIYMCLASWCGACVWSCVYGVKSIGCNNNWHQRETLGTLLLETVLTLLTYTVILK